MSKMNDWPTWPDARDWIGVGSFFLAVLLFVMMWADPTLRKDEFFKTIATLVIGNGFLSVVSWAYGSTKQGNDTAAKLAETAAEPKEVTVTNTDSQPLPVTETKKRKTK